MTGLDKMKSQILDEAKAAAEGKIAEAKAQAEETIRNAKEDAAKQTESILHKSKNDVSNYQERLESSIDLQKRTKILAAKQEVIAGVLEKARAKVEAMEAGEYFSMLLKMVEKYALAQDGEICMCAADLARLPEGFEAEVSRIAKEKGGSLKLSGEGKQIKNGFILVYGGVEENCTINAMFDAKKDELSDIVHRLVFSQA
ncbi:MAG TPA: V-type ATP synthase subunit E [Candidatus Dorea faecigallinarum]|nr:V-type ATP synthase subunit E [Candidatus Dorea faecigallinarum]